MDCPHCGAEVGPQDGRFCPACGLSVRPVKRPTREESDGSDLPKVRCVYCGVASPPPVCAQCGMTLPEPE
jgi:hypothetical protein